MRNMLADALDTAEIMTSTGWKPLNNLCPFHGRECTSEPPWDGFTCGLPPAPCKHEWVCKGPDEFADCTKCGDEVPWTALLQVAKETQEVMREALLMALPALEFLDRRGLSPNPEALNKCREALNIKPKPAAGPVNAKGEYLVATPMQEGVILDGVPFTEPRELGLGAHTMEVDGVVRTLIVKDEPEPETGFPKKPLTGFEPT
jgi:hypothetical protein